MSILSSSLSVAVGVDAFQDFICQTSFSPNTPSLPFPPYTPFHSSYPPYTYALLELTTFISNLLRNCKEDLMESTMVSSARDGKMFIIGIGSKFNELSDISHKVFERTYRFPYA